jgi:hypothetical protein
MINEQLDFMEEDQQVVTLSIGGNDLKFGKVLRACVFKPAGPGSDDCQPTIDEAQDIIDNKLEDILRKGYDAIFAKLNSDYKRKVFVQLYPNFFDETTDWGKDQTLGVFPGYKPLLTKDLRHRLNQLADSARTKMKFIINKYDREYKEPPHDQGGWVETRIFYMDEFDQDIYPTHRFCEDKKKTFDDESIWFFIPGGNDSPKTDTISTSNTTAAEISANYAASSCKDDSRYDIDDLFGWGFDLALYIAADNVSSSTTMFAPGYYVKAFHPKTAAFTEIYKQYKETLPRLAYPLSQNADQGILTCRIEHDDGEKKFYFSRGNALQAIADFCVRNHNIGVNWTAAVNTETDGIIVAAYKDNPMPERCPVTDHTSDDFVAMCKERLGVPFENCESATQSHAHSWQVADMIFVLGDTVKRSSDAWKQGGIFYRDCVTWSFGLAPVFQDLHVNSPDNTTVSVLRRTEMPGIRVRDRD